MRLTRRRRRALGAAAGVGYAVLAAWLLSPIWNPADPVSLDHVRISPVTSAASMEISAPGQPPALPGRLPGSAVASAVGAEAQTTEATEETAAEASAGVPEATASVPETSESQSSSPPSAESSGQPHEETIIGFEG
jgi:hypothetical protein